MQGKPIGAVVSDQSQLDAADVLAACNAALDAAVDLAQPHRSTAHCLTISATIAVAVAHPARSSWAADRLRRFEQQWRAES
jgi:hypothetical protein